MTARNMLYDALRYGTATTARFSGAPAAVALWHPPGMPRVSGAGAVRAVGVFLSNATSLAPVVPHIARRLLRDVPGLIGLVRERRRAVAQASRGVTWRLALLATLPEHRNKGLARALLERQLRRCDEDGAAVWLETTDPVNPPIYQRFGFETVAHIHGPAWLPGLWVMRREPQPA